MTSFSSSSTAHPTRRLSCSAHHLRTVASCPCVSDSPVSSCPPQRTPCTPRNLSSMLESMRPPGALVLPWSSAVEGPGGPGRGIFLLLEEGCPGLCSATFEGPWSLEAPWYLQEEPGGPLTVRLSPSSIWILPLAKAEGSAVHCLPPASQLHALPPRLPEDKGLHCLHPPRPPLISSPGQSEAA